MAIALYNMKQEKDKTTEQLINKTDIDFVNQMINKGGVDDFAVSKSTLANISSWALNGDSDQVIRKKLDLNNQTFLYLIKT